MLIPTALLSLLPVLVPHSMEDEQTAPAPQSPGPLMPWQRNLEDALALSKITGKPLLICVNSDGESASERLAAYQYRDPAFVKLVEGFIPVLASPARHNKRDFDDFGGRLEDPKFGRVVESEHLDIEPLLYRQYFKGRRVAPRHVGVAPDGTLLFDLFLLNNLGEVDSALRKHGVFGAAQHGAAEGIGALFASHDHSDRLRLENLFSESSLPDRVALVGLALSRERSAQHPQIVRLALSSESEELRLAAVQVVLDNPDAGVEFMMDAYRIAEGNAELQAALAKAMSGIDMSDLTNVKNITLRRQIEVLNGLSAKSSCLDASRWELALSMLEKDEAGYGGERSSGLDVDELTESLGKIKKELRRTPSDAQLHQLHAQALLSLAKIWIRDGGGNPTHVLSDASAAALKALKLQHKMPLATAVLANASYLSSDLPMAMEAAVAALSGLHSWAGEPLASDLLDVFAKLKKREVFSAYNSQAEMSAVSIADVCAAHEILLAHPRGTAEQAIEYLNFLNTIGASSREERVVRQALARFGDNGTLHGYLRHYVLRDRGAAGMETAYEDLVVDKEFQLDGQWYAALSVLVAAERHALEERLPQALSAYRISIKWFERVLERNPDYADSSNHYIGMAHAGMARQFADIGDLDASLEELLAAARASITCFGDKDGLDRIPKQTLSQLKGLLKRSQRAEDAEKLVSELVALGLEL